MNSDYMHRVMYFAWAQDCDENELETLIDKLRATHLVQMEMMPPREDSQLGLQLYDSIKELSSEEKRDKCIYFTPSARAESIVLLGIGYLWQSNQSSITSFLAYTAKWKDVCQALSLITRQK